VQVSSASIQALGTLLEARTGQQLTMNRRWRVDAVLQPLAKERGLSSVDALVSLLLADDDPALAERVVEALLNHETSFFRDRTAFDLLLGPALTRLERARSSERRLRIWCAGCSTGQEPYSLALFFAERRSRWHGWTIDILGTDVSRSAIAQARGGTYSQLEVQRGLAVVQMMRWFEEDGAGSWTIAPQLRGAVRFEVHDVASPAPRPGRFDLILCRNVLLYFSPAVRAAAFARLADAVEPDGALMLGAGETVIGQTEAFESDSQCRGLYVRTPEARPLRRAAS
jgi:chemotaxis protein methyltransferase CheR